MHRSRTAGLVRAALAAALLSVSALIMVPFGPVPVTLQLLALSVIILLLSPREALAAVATYVALGAIGLPVFAGGSGGFGVLVGPTGGFLLGFVLGAPLGSLARTRLHLRVKHPLMADVIGVAVLVAVSYAVGLVRFVAVTRTGAGEAAAVAIVPFLIPDAMKAVIAVGVVRRVRRARAGGAAPAVSR